MQMKFTRRKLAQGSGAVAAAALMMFTGMGAASAGSKPSASAHCTMLGGTTITFRMTECQNDKQSMSIEGERYSKTAGEIMWKRVSGAVRYEIIRNNKSLGTHDVLSWYMTDLKEGRWYEFEVRAVDRYGRYMDVDGTTWIHFHNGRFL
jgi:hypothetical protein